MEATLTLTGLAAAMALSLAAGIALAGAGLEAFFRMMFALRAGKTAVAGRIRVPATPRILVFAGDARHSGRIAPGGLVLLPAASTPGRTPAAAEASGARRR